MTDRRIVAMGGGGFSQDQDAALEDYVLGLSGAASPRVCFIPTASGDPMGYIARFYDAFPPTRCRASHLALFQRTETDLRAFVLSQDVLYVGGGNTVSMLAVWRAHGLDTVLREAWEAGVILCGVSAGSLCWFEGGVTDSFGPLAALRDGLGFLPGTHCPHYDSEPGRRPSYQRFIAEGLPAGIAADDGVGLCYMDAALTEAISSRPGAGAYRVEGRAGGVVEERLPVRRLSPSGS